jgi:riboflavin kinase/FMN adenylyltransferase
MRIKTTGNMGSVAALGFFDGVHIGHRAVIRAAQAAADEIGAESAVFTFTGIPPKLFGHAGQVGLILSEKERIRRIRLLGTDYIFCPEFAEIRGITAEDFVKTILIERMNAVSVVCGEDFHFGAGSKADVRALSDICKHYDINTVIVPPVCLEGETVSSTLIRERLITGDIKTANRMLGYEWYFTAEVIHGNQLGRAMNSPTANQIPTGIITPKRGVYAGKAHLPEGRVLPSVTNIGVRPTLNGGNETIVFETHIIGFDGDLYDKELTVSLSAFLREEARFENLQELKEQIKRDIERSIEVK